MTKNVKKKQVKKKKSVENGTIRIKVKDEKPYEKTKTGWKKSSVDISNIIHVIDLFKAHDNLSIIVSKKNPEFFKGMISPDEKVLGERVKFLPDGRELDKPYSLFAKHLTVHDESSHGHWDIMFQNPGGTFCYIYTKEKIKKARLKKYKKVHEFEKYYPKIKRNSSMALKNKDDKIALPMYTLLKTYMRIGNEIYYNAHGHKGLTTLMKKDIKINGNKVSFNYIAKDGVPQNIIEKFPETYISRLKNSLSKRKSNSFVFCTESGHPLSDMHFKEGFKRYCGKEFYPHIVRSYYATKTAKDFLKKRKKPTKEEVKNLFMSIADKLGHKRYNKKSKEWKDNYEVTIHYYIKPDLVEMIKSRVVD